MSDEQNGNVVRTWLDDPNVIEALKERIPDDVALLSCPECGEHSYYNQGSHFTCAFCETGFCVIDDNEEPPDWRPWILSSDLITVGDLMRADPPDANHVDLS